jgi:hypothetical protein
VFGPLKEALGGKKFSTDDEIKEAVHRWLRSQSEEFFFSRGIQALVKRCTPTLNVVGTMLRSDSVFKPIYTYSVSKKNIKFTF